MSNQDNVLIILVAVPVGAKLRATSKAERPLTAPWGWVFRSKAGCQWSLPNRERFIYLLYKVTGTRESRIEHTVPILGEIN